MKKIIAFFCTFMLLVNLSACAEEKSVDESFINDLKSGLMTRWDFTNEDDSTNEPYTQEDWDEYINAELSKISSYKESEFENKKLGELANTYISLLEDSQKITKYVESDYDRFWAEYQPILDDRCVTLMEINNISEIAFTDKNDKKDFEGLLNDAELVIAVRNIVENLEFTMVEKEENQYSDYREYEAILENTSDFDFKFFNININLVDENGIVVETNTVWTENWEPKTKHKFNFSTDETFANIEIKTMDYGL